VRRIFGPRNIVEAAFLVAVPLVAAFAVGAGKAAIIAASAVAYLLVIVFEYALWRERTGRRPAAKAVDASGMAPAETVTVIKPEPEPEPEPEVPEPEPEPVAAAQTEPAPEPEPEPEPEPVPIEQPPVAAVPETPPEPAPGQERREPGHVRVLRPEPEPEPVPAEQPPLVAVPDLPPEPAPAVAAAPLEPVGAPVVPIGVGSGPRRWNLWDLERLTREHSGDDAVRDEERTFLLMYLREFADPDGMLPIDFDGLVRDSFGDLVGSR
jgi:hypothetical protein